VQTVAGVAGVDPLTFASRTNAGAVWLPLKPWDERGDEDLSPSAVVNAVYAASGAVKDAFFLAFEPPPIEGLGTTGGFEAYIQSRGGGDAKDLERVTREFVELASKRPELAGITTTYSASVPQIRIDLDREKAMTLGVPVNEVFETLQSTFGALYVNDFNRSGRVFQVQLQSEPRFRAFPEDIRDVYVRSGSGDLVPLTALASVKASNVRFHIVHDPPLLELTPELLDLDAALRLLARPAPDAADPDGDRAGGCGQRHQPGNDLPPQRAEEAHVSGLRIASTSSGVAAGNTDASCMQSPRSVNTRMPGWSRTPTTTISS